MMRWQCLGGNAAAQDLLLLMHYIIFVTNVELLSFLLLPLILSYQDSSLVYGEMNGNGGGPRWRSDEASDGEEKQNPGTDVGIGSHATPARGSRRIRFSRR